jgi:VCBS repeat-containing protein
MATATIGTTSVTFSNSGAAANEGATTTEDNRTATFSIAQILADSGGGTKTTFYSLDNGTAGDNNTLVTTNKAFVNYDTDLLYKDSAVSGWITGGDTSALGAKVWIGTDNLVHYDATGLNFDYLAAGESAIDTIQYTIKMSNGTLAVGTLTVTIGGVNDAPVFTSDNAGSIDENSPTATVAYDANATDAEGDTIEFSLASGGDNDLFDIDPDTGEVTFKVSPNFEDSGHDNTYDITVKASDGFTTTEKSVTITVNDVNEAPTVSLTNTVTSTPENGGDVKVADIVVSDDALGTNGLTLSGADAALFTIVDGVGGKELHFIGGADFETDASYDVTVEVDDATVGATPDDTAPLTLAITDVADSGNAPAGLTFIPTETGSTLTPFGHFFASDEDSGDVDYVLVASTGLTGKGLVVDAETGNLSFTTASSTAFSGTVTVKATDGTNESSEVVFSVQVGSNNDPDSLTSTADNSILVGRGGGDTLTGGAGIDYILAGQDGDTITGKGSADAIIGGGGIDRIVYQTSNDSSVGDGDEIYSFTNNGGNRDIIDLSALGVDGNDVTVAFNNVSGNTVISVDTDNNTTADMEITLIGVNLNEADIVFDYTP